MAACAPSAPQAAAPAAPPAAPPSPVAVVSYTQAQAEQGRQVFNSVCSACHGANEFRGPIFRQTWMARPIGDFYQHISTAMPQDNPGGLSPAQYAAIVAHVLQLNGHPAGTELLPPDAQLLAGMAWPR